MDVSDAKAVCECKFLGLELEGMTPSVNANVVGVGVGIKVYRGMPTGETALRVYVKKKVHPLMIPEGELIPDFIEGVPTDIDAIGEVRIKWPFPPVFQRRLRPARPGISIGHRDVSAGTFGLVVRTATEKGLILSNNHVLANENRGVKGDVILQPGDWDGGKSEKDSIGSLASFVPLKEEETNQVDAALAQPYDPRDIAPDIVGIGRVAGTVEPRLGMAVTKAGRTTRITRGEVTDMDVTLLVGYTNGSLLFQDQMILRGRGGFSGPGDSGSAILDMENRVCGLLFAGSPVVTIANRWAKVASALGVTPV